jgi:hypothetical protein
MKNTNIILYTPGAYGNFINWCCSYFSGLITDIEIPFTGVGSVHNSFSGQKHLSLPIQFKEFLISKEDSPFLNLHEFSINDQDQTDISEGKFLEVLDRNLTFLNDNFSKIVYIFSTANSISWITNNCYFKIKPLEDTQRSGIENPQEFFVKKFNIPKSSIRSMEVNGVERFKLELEINQKIQENLINFGHQHVNDFEIWELREFSSHYYHDMIHAQLLTNTDIDELKLKFKNIYFVKLDSLRNDFNNCLTGILDHFNIKSNVEDLSKIHSQWIDKQHFINNDLLINTIVKCLINNIDFDWSDNNLTFFDEAIIQRKLLDNNISIACYGLNIFPTSTKLLSPLLIREDK